MRCRMSGMVPGDGDMVLLAASAIKNAEDYATFMKSMYGDFADRFIAMYPFDEKSNLQFIQQMANDQMMAKQNLLAEQRVASGDKDTYLYLFTHVLPGPECALNGAFHTSDVPYFLNKFSDSRALYWTDTDYKVGHTASQYLLNFA